MRVWERVIYAASCGGCGTRLDEGTPIQTISTHGLRRKLIRCANCADSQVPPDLPALPERETIEQKMARFPLMTVKSVVPTRTRGALKTMAREYLPHPDD